MLKNEREIRMTTLKEPKVVFIEEKKGFNPENSQLLNSYMTGILSMKCTSQTNNSKLIGLRERMNHILDNFQKTYRAIMTEEIRLKNYDHIADNIVDTYDFIEAIDETIKKEIQEY